MADVTHQLTHQATGSPGVLLLAAKMAKDCVARESMSSVEVTALVLAHVLAIELAAALQRINEMENRNA